MIAIISDIHGNLPAFEAVLQDIKSRKVDSIISLGDIAGYYCFINECIELCRENNIINILGNHDEYLISKKGCPRSYSANVCLKYQMDTITSDNLLWLSNSIRYFDDEKMSLRHGGWNDPLDEYIYDFSFDLVLEYSQSIFASGHTHIQSYRMDHDKVYFNPGSVGQPRDYNPRAAYAIINDDGSVELFRCDYPIEKTVDKMIALGFQERISSCLYRGCKIGE